MRVKGLIYYINLLSLVSYGQIKKIPASPENLARSLKSIEFQLTKVKVDPRIIWNNYHSEHDIPDSAYYNLSSLRIKCVIAYPATADSIIAEPFVYSGHSKFSEKVIILPYSKFQLGMTFLIDLTDTVTLRHMKVVVKIDSLDKDSPSDRTFCFNYIPFVDGKFCFSGKDIEHWDVQTTTINPANSWFPCQHSIGSSAKDQTIKERKRKSKA